MTHFTGNKLIAIVLLVVVVAGGLGYWMATVEKPSEPAAASFITQSSAEQKSGLVVDTWSSVPTLLHGVFPATHNCTSLTENTDIRTVDSVEITQMLPDGFNVTDAYPMSADDSQKPTITAQGLRYSLSTPLRQGQRVAAVVLLQETSTSRSGNITTEAVGITDGKEVRSQSTAWFQVQSSKSTCADWDTIIFGEYVLRNDVWGGPDETHLQCLSYQPNSFGWNSSRSKPQEDVPCYPSVIYGK